VGDFRVFVEDHVGVFHVVAIQVQVFFVEFESILGPVSLVDHLAVRNGREKYRELFV
jgi:hypothetical protein